VFDWIYTLYELDKHFGMTNVKEMFIAFVWKNLKEWLGRSNHRWLHG